MVDFRRGIIAGVAAAAVFLIISVILEVTGLADRSWMFVEAAGLRIWFYSTEPLHVLSVILPRLVPGVIFGAVFAALYFYLPRRTAVRQAMAVSLMIWAIGRMQRMYHSLRWPWQAEGMVPDTASYGTAVITYDLGGMLISIASAVAFGALAGAIWNRLKAREAREPRPGSAALLIGFAIGVSMWLGPASRVVVDVAVRGPFWETLMWWWPERFWWPGILILSAAVLGLAGWILVLLGWRRTRRGETGFRRGLAGGILMAVTGVMLLPGVVSIIGAVLSRREPESEPASGAESAAP
ncbi:MAG: hypothetical protein ACNA7X_03060 [Dehalococcoidia bacterium]